MVDQILEKWIEPRIGELKENGEKWYNPWANGNGIAEAGETFEYKGTKNVLTSQDVSSYEAFDKFLEKVTSAKVDFIRNDGGGLKYFVYRHFQDATHVVDASGRDLYGAYGIETPNFDAFAANYAEKIVGFTKACDVEGVLRLSMVYNSLISSAKVYAPEARDYRGDVADFSNRDHLNSGDVEGFLNRTAHYNEVARAYGAAKDVFYFSQPVNRCAPQQPSEPRPIPPSNPRPIPPSQPHPIPDEDGNNPDEVEDI